jgi:hypothetical protein
MQAAMLAGGAIAVVVIVVVIAISAVTATRISFQSFASSRRVVANSPR